LATLQPRSPSSNGWLHEVKFDGYRVQMHIRETGTRLFTRRGHDWTDRFHAFVVAAATIKAHSAVLDGEVIVPAARGLSDFGALETELAARRSDRLVFYVFDVLYVDGFDLRRVPLIERRHVLAALVDGADARIKCSEFVEEDGKKIFRNACRLGLEGVVSKRRDSRYQSGRTSAWVKATCRKRDTFWAAGVAFKDGKFDGLYLGRREGERLHYAGKVERGFDDKTAREVVSELLPLKLRKSPLAEKIRKPKATWVKPVVPVDVEYRALTGQGLVRHPSFKGIRRDLAG
jgi:bifunctional non-homologous end joining protein LigD